MSKHMYSTANLTDVELKDQGNRMFSARKYEDAINLYTKAIVSGPNVMLCFSIKIPLRFCSRGINQNDVGGENYFLRPEPSFDLFTSNVSSECDRE